MYDESFGRVVDGTVGTDNGFQMFKTAAVKHIGYTNATARPSRM